MLIVRIVTGCIEKHIANYITRNTVKITGYEQEIVGYDLRMSLGVASCRISKIIRVHFVAKAM